MGTIRCPASLNGNITDFLNITSTCVAQSTIYIGYLGVLLAVATYLLNPAIVCMVTIVTNITLVVELAPMVLLPALGTVSLASSLRNSQYRYIG